MPNRWIEFVKSWAKKNNVSYGCALSEPKMKIDYRKSYPTKQQITERESKEREQMKENDINEVEKKVLEETKAEIKKLGTNKNSSVIKLAKLLKPEMSNDGKFVKNYDIEYGGMPTWRTLRIDDFNNFWLFSSLDEWIGILKQNGNVYLFKDDEYPSEEAYKYYNAIMKTTLKKNFTKKEDYLKILYGKLKVKTGK